MKTETNLPLSASLPRDERKSTARLIAMFGESRIVRHRDGSLDVCSGSAGERNAALAWICAVSPDLVLRVRRGPDAAGAHN